MAYEFTPMSEVEISAEPAETSHVFIEEGGVVKRAPFGVVGGGGGGLLVEITTDMLTDDEVLTICSMNYDKIYETLIKGGTVTLAIQDSYFDGDGSGHYNESIGKWQITNPNYSYGSGLYTELWDCTIFFPNGSYNIT